jgi:hypothetical protein
MFIKMSSSIFPHFLFLVGLNFINVLSAAAVEGPSQRFAEKLEAVPSKEFFDLVPLGDVIWLAGDGLYKLSGDNWEGKLSDARYTALAVQDNSILWAGGSGEITKFDSSGQQLGIVPVDVGFVWSLVYTNGGIWYFGSEGFGWIDPGQLEVENHWSESFQPRPFVLESAKS